MAQAQYVLFRALATVLGAPRQAGRNRVAGARRGETDGSGNRQRPFRYLPTGAARHLRQAVAAATRQKTAAPIVRHLHRAAPGFWRRRRTTPRLVERHQPPPNQWQIRNRFHGQSILVSSSRGPRASRAPPTRGPSSPNTRWHGHPNVAACAHHPCSARAFRRRLLPHRPGSPCARLRYQEPLRPSRYW